MKRQRNLPNPGLAGIALILAFFVAPESALVMEQMERGCEKVPAPSNMVPEISTTCAPRSLSSPGKQASLATVRVLYL